MEKIAILWADDEIDLLKPHILFLEDKGYQVVPVVSGHDAVEEAREKDFDIIFLDENMPGMTGLETLEKLKDIKPHIPVVMITKSEEELVMDDAIGSQIADYLIKPVNPKQILLSIKKVVDTRRLVSEKITTSYQQDFRNLAMRVNEPLNYDEWVDVYRKIIYWDMELVKSSDDSMKDVLQTQQIDANANFSRFIESNYMDWLNGEEDAPLLSHQLMKKKVFPLIDKKKPVVMLVIDNLRYDQWKVLQPRIAQFYRLKEETAYYSILPTATHYARNAIFSGMLPSDIEKKYPKWWLNDDEEGGKNLHEADFLGEQIRNNKLDIKYSYQKITQLEQGRNLADNAQNLLNYDLSVIVYNFVDLLSHMRTEMEMIKELAEDEAAYRSLTLSWFDHSPLLDILKKLSEKDITLILTTDHGTIRVKKPSKIIGDKNTTTNLRYKHGRNLNFEKRDVLHIKNPSDAKLPKPNVSSSYVFAKEDFYFVYPNNYNYYVNFFKNTFQHGGISLQEMIIPIVVMESR